MQSGRPVPALILLVAIGLAACRDAKIPAASQGSNTATMGGYGPGPKAAPPPPLLDVHGQPIPLPQAPSGARLRAARVGDQAALAVWVQGGHVVASSYAPGAGWTAPQPLEEIYGQASDPEVAGNGKGVAMAVWRHTVGNIDSLRFSRFEADHGWSVPDVMPGALPRPRVDGAVPHDGPRLYIEPDGDVSAQWPSGFSAAEVQTARYVSGRGWSRALNESVASASRASPGLPFPSSAR